MGQPPSSSANENIVPLDITPPKQTVTKRIVTQHTTDGNVWSVFYKEVDANGNTVASGSYDLTSSQFAQLAIPFPLILSFLDASLGITPA